MFRRDTEAEFLLLHYGAGHWDFPKGQVERDESERDTAAREVKEETGISDIHFLEGFRQKIRYFYRREGRIINKEVTFFLIEAGESEVKLSYEHVGYEWLAYEGSVERLTFANARKVLRSAFEFLNTRGIIK